MEIGKVFKVTVQEVLIRDEFSVIAQEVPMGDTNLIVVVIIVVLRVRPLV